MSQLTRPPLRLARNSRHVTCKLLAFAGKEPQVDPHPGTWPVSAAMSAEFASVRANDRLDFADQIMQLGRVRHMPVLDAAGRVVGIVSHRDLLENSLSRLLAIEPAARRAHLGTVEVAEVMTRRVETIAPGATLARAAERMLHHRIGCLPVVRHDGVMIGILTETDLLRRAYCDAGRGSILADP